MSRLSFHRLQRRDHGLPCVVCVVACGCVCIHVVSPRGGNVSTVYPEGTNQASVKGSLRSEEAGARTRMRAPSLKDGKELKLKLKLLASITGK